MIAGETQKEDFDQLWGGVVEHYEIDLSKHAFFLTVTVKEHGRESKFEVQFSGISRLSFADDLIEDWDYIYLTSIHAVQKEGNWFVEMELWEANLELTCKTVEITSAVPAIDQY